MAVSFLHFVLTNLWSGTHLAELLQIELERLHVHVEAQRGHGEKDVLAVDGLPLLLVAALASL